MGRRRLVGPARRVGPADRAGGRLPRHAQPPGDVVVVGGFVVDDGGVVVVDAGGAVVVGGGGGGVRATLGVPIRATEPSGPTTRCAGSPAGTMPSCRALAPNAGAESCSSTCCCSWATRADSSDVAFLA